MAQGYDARQSSRQTFAFAAPQGRQTRNDAAATPNIGRTGVTGGQATGGGNVVQSSNPVSGAGAGAQIPAFLESVLEPVIKAQQDKRVYEGYAAAANGEALTDIAERQPMLASIFGPTDFQRGAQFFATQEAVSTWKAEQLGNMNQLRQLPPEELGTYLYEAAQSHMTGDTFADNAINAAIIEESATLLPRIAQARTEWQQTELTRGFRSHTTAAGSAYGAMVTSYTSQPELAEGETDTLGANRIDLETINAQKETFLSSFLPLDGMTPEAYKAGVTGTARAFLAEGNLWAFNAMNEGGSNSLLFSVMEPEEYATLQSAYKAAGAAAQARALFQVGPEYDLFRTEVRLGQVSPEDVRERLNEFNVRIATLTGYDIPYFDGEAIMRQTEGRVDDLVSGIERDEARAYSEYREDYNRNLDNQEKAAEEQAKINGVTALATTGDLQAAKFQYGESTVNMTMTAALRSDPTTTIPFLIMSHQNSSEIVSGARDVLQSQVAANIGAGYDSQSFQTAYTNWKTFDGKQGGHAARAAYYGQYDNMFARMTTLMANGGVTGTLAYAQTFGEAGALAGTQQPATAPTGEVADSLKAAVVAVGPGFWQRQTGGRQTLAATNTIERLAFGGAYQRMQADPELPAEEALRMEQASLVADRRLEIVGRDAWANPTRGATMSDLTRVPSDRLGNVWQSLVDEGLERVAAQGRPYTVWRSGQGPATRWIVSVTPRNGGDAEAFEINAPMIISKDRTTEQADVRRRRPNAPAPVQRNSTRGAGDVNRR